MHAFDAIQTPQQRDVLVAFSDLSAFTRVVQDLGEGEAFALMAEYYELVGDIVASGGGKVVKFIGDAALLVFPADGVDAGVLVLRALKEQGDQFFASRDKPCRHVIKVHFGPVCCGPIGTRDDKRFDLFGQAVNIAALLSSNGLALTPQVFRRLAPETRQYFKKHTPPITYIAVADRHS
jgi:adenylate cyclase